LADPVKGADPVKFFVYFNALRSMISSIDSVALLLMLGWVQNKEAL
jgi:hypothetical protein